MEQKFANGQTVIVKGDTSRTEWSIVKPFIRANRRPGALSIWKGELVCERYDSKTGKAVQEIFFESSLEPA